MCFSCKKGYGKIREMGECEDCKNNPVTYFSIIVSTLIILAMLILIKSAAMKSKDEERYKIRILLLKNIVLHM